MQRPISGTSRNPWSIVAYLCLMQAFTIGIAGYTFPLYVVPWSEEFGISNSSLMLVATVYSITLALSSPLGGVLLDRVDYRLLIQFGLGIYIGCLVLLSTAGHIALIALIFGVMIPATLVVCGPLISLWIVARLFTVNRGLALGVTALGMSAGGVVLPVLTTQLFALYGWRTTLLLLAGTVALFVLLPGMGWMRRWELPDTRAPDTGVGTLRLILSPPVLQLGLAYCVPTMMFVAVLFNMASLAGEIGLPQSQAAMAISLASLAMACGKVGFGYVCDRAPLNALYVAMVAAIGLAMWLTAQASSLAALLSGVVLLAFVVGGMGPYSAALAADRWPGHQLGRVLGVVQGFGALSAMGAYLLSLLRDTVGSYGPALLCLSLGLLPAIIAFMMLTASSHASQVTES